ncbi:MAG: glycosyltransferase [Rhodobacteraceae bacterium]|nr:glycosyltransferase [Paracoccaceae bacterium]
MSLPSASVVVVSRDRPGLLCRCIRSLAWLDHPRFEVVVVADAAGLAALAAAGLDAPLICARQDGEGIAAARNAGIALAAGEVVAFLDDDAVPEPSWLARLVAPLADPEVAAAGGFVRGRNGFSFQWRGREVAPDAAERPIPDWGPEPRVFPPSGERAVKLQGTNMAVRRRVLAELGGFDPAFRFYLDDADLSLRLARAGQAVALVPGAEVHHGFAASPRRRADRAPLSLHDIGASLAAFLARHAPPAAAGPAVARQRAEERGRLVRHMVAGGIEPGDIARLMATFEAGLAEGARRPPGPLPPLPSPAAPFRPYPARPAPMRVLAGRPWQARHLRAEAAARTARGEPVTLFLFGPTARPHRLRFTEGGWWEQSGGLFGRSLREGPRIRPTGFRRRLAEEVARLAAVRDFQPIAPG